MIYLDHAATTRPDGDALRRAAVYTDEKFYNPSALYGGGLRVRADIREARAFLLSKLADGSFDLIFTSGGTEADNQAIFCGGRRGNVVTTAGEHAAVKRPCAELKNRGVEVRFAPLNRDGSVNAEALLRLVDEKTSLVSVIHTNNETGAVNDILSLAKAVKGRNPRTLFHSDGVQAFGKIPFRLSKEIDLYSVSAHKIGGLKGTGALFKRGSLALAPYLYGGGQEDSLRSGTENVFGIMDFYFAAQKKFSEIKTDFEKLRTFKRILTENLDGNYYAVLSPEAGSPYIVSVAAKNLRGEVLQRMIEERGVIVGTGSACSSKRPFSEVIEACGYGKEILYGVLRVSFSPETTGEEVLLAARAMNEAAGELAERTGEWKR